MLSVVVADGWEVTVIGCRNMYSDDDFCRVVASLLPGVEHVEVTVPRWHELEQALLRQEVLLTSRYHSTIMAARTGRPVLVVDPVRRGFGGSKLEELMSDLGGRDDAYWSLDSSPSPLSDFLRAALANRREYNAAYSGMRHEALAGLEMLVVRLAAALQL